MKKLFLVTANQHKVVEIGKILEDYGVEIVQKKFEIIEPDFDTLEKVAVAKAKQAFEKVKKPVIAEDTGVYFEGYNKFPGQIAKRVYRGLGFDGLLTLIKAAKTKRAYFKTVICFAKSKNSYELFSGTLKGKLIERIVSRDKNRLPYEKLFIPGGQKKAMVDIDLEEKNKISHRAIAARKLGRWIEENY